jgi:hypothetical protein
LLLDGRLHTSFTMTLRCNKVIVSLGFMPKTCNQLLQNFFFTVVDGIPVPEPKLSKPCPKASCCWTDASMLRSQWLWDATKSLCHLDSCQRHAINCFRISSLRLRMEWVLPARRSVLCYSPPEAALACDGFHMFICIWKRVLERIYRKFLPVFEWKNAGRVSS